MEFQAGFDESCSEFGVRFVKLLWIFCFYGVWKNALFYPP